MPLDADKVTNAAWALPDAESALLKLKQLLCTGSFLKGYTARQPGDNVSRVDVEKQLIELQRAVCHIAEQAGFSPVNLSESVHGGFDRIIDPRRAR